MDFLKSMAFLTITAVCAYKTFEKMDSKRRPVSPIIIPDEEYDIPVLHASCPVCGSGLGHDMSDHKAKCVSYCETCGQAIRWDGLVRDKATS